MMGRLTSKIRGFFTPEFLRENGVKLLMIRILEATYIFRQVILVECPLDQSIPEVSAKIPIVISLLKSNETEELADFCALYCTLEKNEIGRRLNEGQLCFVVRHNGRIVHASWCAFSAYSLDYLGLRINLAPDEAYLYGMHTATEFRSLGIARARVAWSLTYLRNAGYKLALSEDLPENKPTQRATRPLGFQPTGWLSRIVLGPLKFTLYKPLRKKAQ